MSKIIDKKANVGDILLDNLIYLLLLVIFIFGIFAIILQLENGAVVWEDYYAKEIVKVIDFSNAGDRACLDVHKATEIAKKNNVKSFSEIFIIDNPANEVCVKLSLGRKTCFNYWNDVDIVNIDLKFGLGENEKNKLCFELVEVQR